MTCSLNTARVHDFSKVYQFFINSGIFRKRCTHGSKCKDAVVGPDLD